MLVAIYAIRRLVCLNRLLFWLKGYSEQCWTHSHRSGYGLVKIQVFIQVVWTVEFLPPHSQHFIQGCRRVVTGKGLLWKGKPRSLTWYPSFKRAGGRLLLLHSAHIFHCCRLGRRNACFSWLWWHTRWTSFFLCFREVTASNVCPEISCLGWDFSLFLDVSSFKNRSWRFNPLLRLSATWRQCPNPRMDFFNSVERLDCNFTDNSNSWPYWN